MGEDLGDGILDVIGVLYKGEFTTEFRMASDSYLGHYQGGCIQGVSNRSANVSKVRVN